MESNPNEHKNTIEDNGNSIFGTSSDAIIEGLHQGQFIESNVPDDDRKIVNEQEQNEIINPVEPDATTATPEIKSQEEALPATDTETIEISEAEQPLIKKGNNPEIED